MTRQALVADLGGTNMRVALVDQEGRTAHRSSVPTQAQRGRDSVVERLVEAFERTLATVDVGSVAGIGVSVAGPTDQETGVMYNPPNLPGWHGYSLKPVLGEKFGLVVSVANDASLAALAEHRYGAGQGYDNVVYLTISTGIGGGIVIEGRLYGGSQGLAGEIGHMTIDRSGPECSCGNVGCLETLASGTAVARMARERLASGETSLVQARAGGGPANVTAADVAEAVRAGDRMAREIFDEVSANLGIGIVGVVHALNPDVIVLGGGMTRDFDLLLPGINEVVGRRALRLPEGRSIVVKSQLGDDGGLLGAAAIAFDHSS